MGAIDLSQYLWPDVAQGRQPQGATPLFAPEFLSGDSVAFVAGHKTIAGAGYAYSETGSANSVQPTKLGGALALGTTASDVGITPLPYMIQSLDRALWLIQFVCPSDSTSYKVFGAGNNSGGYVEEFDLSTDHTGASVFGKFRLYLRSTSGSVTAVAPSSAIFTAGGFYTLAILYDRLGSNVSCFCNGQPVALTFNSTAFNNSTVGRMPGPTRYSIGNFYYGGMQTGSTNIRISMFARLPGFTGDARKVSENPWQIFAPQSIPFFLTAGGTPTDSLTVSGITASTATVGSPALGQTHAISAAGIAASSTVGSPALGQTHSLTAASIVAASTISSPALTEIVAGGLTAQPIIAQPAVIGSPSLGQVHSLSASAIAAGPATFGTPTLAQQHALMASGITASPALLSSPTLTESGAAPFTPEQLAYILDYVEANLPFPTTADISSAVLAALQATAIPVNIKQVNDVTIKGVGTPSNPWNPV